MSISKKEILKDINYIIEHSRNQARFNRAELESQENFINSLLLIIKNEAPEFIGKMTEIKDHYLKLLSKEKLLIEAEERYAEDLNDISIRFEVIYRLNEELIAGKKKVKDSRLRIDKLRKELEIDSVKGGQKKDKIEAEIAKAIDAKKEAIDELDAKYVQVIDQREKFAKFRINRLQHAFTNFGLVITSSMKEYTQEGEAFQSLINETQDQIDQLLEAGPPQPEEEEIKEVAGDSTTDNQE
ncbi:hypothetical protein M9Y10_040967 [Tritrichomonas musculus]|uniref:Uncharacterized protein n=1 Tax=Tritrichomonas musculus TaxID=1915356 RepID=A0ABR2K339_9EUKA